MVDKVELQVRRELLDPHFDGYKLCLDRLPTYASKIDCEIDSVQLSSSQYSYHHAKLFGVHNHLYADPWNPTQVFFIDKHWGIIKASSEDSSVVIHGKVCTIPDITKQRSVSDCHNVSLCVVSEDIVVVGDGAGKLHVLLTGNRSQTSQQWKVLSSLNPFPEIKPFMLLDAVLHSEDGSYKIECLCVRVIESDDDQKEKYRSPHLTVVEWITLSSGDKTVWTLDRNRRLIGRRPLDYAAIDKQGNSVIISAEADMNFEYDSLKPVVPEEAMEVTHGAEDKIPEYTWSQTYEDVSVQFTVPVGITKADIYLSLAYNHIDFGIKNGKQLLKGQLHAGVDVEGSTWTMQNQKIELTLEKKEKQMWSQVVMGDNRGEMTADPAVVAQIHERLAGLTSEQLNPDPQEGIEKAYNSQQLEDCDAFPEDSSTLMRFDGNTHKITHQTNLGSHQFLFTALLDFNKPKALCLRHDVDGIVWQPENNVKENQLPWQHISTFNAFGYVQASKQNRKFTVCSPDCSYVVICDMMRHAYVYRQPSSIHSPVRNRKTGRQVSAIAKQQVISLDCVDHIIGIQATSHKLFILTESVLHAVQVNTSNI